MSIAGLFFLFLLTIWTTITVILIATSGITEMFMFLRSVYFIVIAIGYIGIVGTFFVLDKIARSGEENYGRPY